MTKKRSRSPAYPAIELSEAIQRAQTLYDKDRRNEVPVAVAMEHLGYKTGSGVGGRVIAALKQFGLLKEQGKKDDRRVQLTERALAILLAPNETDKERESAIRSAAISPPLHKELIEHFDGDLPSDATIRSHLLRQRSFNDDYVDGFIQQMRETFALAQIGPSDTISTADEENNGDGRDDPPAVNPPPPPKSRLKRKGDPMAVDVKEDVLSLNTGDVVFQRPTQISEEDYQDVADWLEIVLRRMKRESAACKNEPIQADNE